MPGNNLLGRCARWHDSQKSFTTLTLRVILSGSYALSDGGGTDETTFADATDSRIFTRDPFEPLVYYGPDSVPPALLKFWLVQRCCCAQCQWDMLIGSVPNTLTESGEYLDSAFGPINGVGIGTGGFGGYAGGALALPWSRTFTGGGDSGNADAHTWLTMLPASALAARCRDGDVGAGYVFLLGAEINLPSFSTPATPTPLLAEYLDSAGQTDETDLAWVSPITIPESFPLPEADSCADELSVWRQVHLTGEDTTDGITTTVDLTLRAELELA